MTPNFEQPLPDACPPESATRRQQPAYRIVRGDPPSKTDFKTHAELGLAWTYGLVGIQWHGQPQRIQRCG